MRTRRKLAFFGGIFLGSFALFLIAFLALRYDPSQLQGDARITDAGLWSHPRYEVRFPRVSLKTTGTYAFVCKGLPPEKMTFMLEMPDRKRKWEEVREFFRRNPNGTYSEPYDRQKFEALLRNRTVVELTLIGNDQTIFSVAAPLHEWVLMWESGNTGGFWHPKAKDLNSSPRVNYKLIFIIKEVDPDGTLEEIVPLLQGGGIEVG
jgi:hypothetical protein